MPGTLINRRQVGLDFTNARTALSNAATCSRNCRQATSIGQTIGARGAKVDVLVTDVGLPGGLNGRQVADAVREHKSGLPVLFITGYAGSALEGQLAPGMQVIGKPFALDTLAAKVRAMFEAPDE